MLYLLPNLLGEAVDEGLFFPQQLGDIVSSLHGLIAESEKGGRLFMKRFIDHFRSLPIHLLNEHTTSIDPLLGPLQRGEIWGLVSDAGLPILADPGASLVRRLHTMHIAVMAIPGPSAIIQALQLSGFSAQSFTFHGYPPKNDKVLREKVRTLPKNHTHIFIEAPYRTDKFLRTLVDSLQEGAELSVSSNLTLPSQSVKTLKVREWRAAVSPLGKVPAVFVIRGAK